MLSKFEKKLPLPDVETDIKREADADADKEDDVLSEIDDLIKLSNRVGGEINSHSSHNTVRAVRHTAFPKQ